MYILQSYRDNKSDNYSSAVIAVSESVETLKLAVTQSEIIHQQWTDYSIDGEIYYELITVDNPYIETGYTISTIKVI